MLWCCQEVQQYCDEPHRSPSLLLATLFVYVCDLLIFTASPALSVITPIQALTGQVSDIRYFLHFSSRTCCDENEPDHKFPSQSDEKR